MAENLNNLLQGHDRRIRNLETTKVVVNTNVVSTKTVSYVLVTADKGTRVVMNSASATTITVNGNFFAAEDTLFIQNIGAGVCTITAGTATVSTSGSLALAQYQSGTLYFVSTGAAIFFPEGGGTPSGTLSMFAGTTAPTGYFICNGDAISRTTYATLFGVVGTTYGAGDSSTTFNLPDLRGRAPIGVGTGTGLTARALGATTGTETHTLTAAQIPGHTHAVTIMGSDLSYGTAALQGSAGGTQQNINSAEGGGSNPASGGSHPNMQPSFAINFIIKT